MQVVSTSECLSCSLGCECRFFETPCYGSEMEEITLEYKGDSLSESKYEGKDG
jgi:hypothetical protein